MESAKLRALRSHVPTCFSCSHALRAYVLTCQHVLRAYVLTCQRVLHVYLLTCQLALRAHVPIFLTRLHANLSCVPTYLRALTSHNKNKFSMTCFPWIWNKTVHDWKSSRSGASLETSILRIQPYIPAFSFTRRKPLIGARTMFWQ